MATENLRGIWTRIQQPIVDRLSGVDPAVLTWTSLLFAFGGCYLLASADRSADSALHLWGALACIVVAAELDALDGAVARTFGKVSKYGDWLDHSLDRVIDLSILIAIGANLHWVANPSLGWAAATFTLLGSYMGTQAQSVGLGRNYGGFSRADRMVVTCVGIGLAAIQAMTGAFGDLALPASLSSALEIDSLNPLNAVLLISLLGGIWTFSTRFVSARKGIIALDAESE